MSKPQTYGLSVEIEQDSIFNGVSLEELKGFLRIDLDYVFDDETLKTILNATVQQFEKYTYLNFSIKTVVCQWLSFSGEDMIMGGPVYAINEVFYINDSGSEVILDTTEYSILGHGFTKVLRLKNVITQPVGVRFQGGFQKIPIDIKHAILKQAATYFENRENFVIGASVEQLTNDSTAILDKYVVSSYIV